MTKFKCTVDLGPNSSAENIVYAEFDKDEFDLTYDEVIDELYSEMDEKYPTEFYPKAEIKDIFIIKHENGKDNEYPVLAESQNTDKYQLAFDKILVLPEARYSLTPEMKLYMNMVKRGLIDKDHEFDFDEMHEICGEFNSYMKEKE